jgi:hypothetical protein
MHVRFRCPVMPAILIVLFASMVSWTPADVAMEGMTPQELFPWATFDSGVPTQETVTGVRPGARALRHDEVRRYLQTLADSSPRARLETYSRTHEGRELMVMTISDEQTMTRIDDLKTEHARRVDPRSRPASEDAATLAGAKAVAWMAYAIHGDELSSSDAACALAYWLVAGEDDQAKRLREKLVILIDPMENPDGRDRFLAQTRSFAHARPNPDTEDLSHTTVWPWGRGNHYLFDLNRDWFAMVQPESKRSEVIATWNPQLLVDSHEMGSSDTYLFSPPRAPFNPFLPPTTRDWAKRFAADQARALDGRGYAYYTREWNEEFFPGYGSSWASYLGAVGILYEMSGTEGTLVKQRPGTVRTYTEAVEHQAVSSVANLETLAANREAVLLDYVADRRAAIAEGKKGPVRAWIFPPVLHPERTHRLAGLLRRQGIEIVRLAEAVRTRDLRDARTGETVEIELPAGTWMVPMDQPAVRLARVLLDPHIPMEATFLREEREFQERGKGTRLYETTAWSLPLAYGVDAYWTSTKPGGSWTDARPMPPTGTFKNRDEAYGYLIDGASDNATGALADLLQRGIAVRIADKKFSAAGREFDRGAVLVKREGNPEDLVDQLGEVALRWGVIIEATSTALAEGGPDLGGRHFRPLVAPRVGVWTGSPVSSSSYGAIWHMLDLGLDLRFSGLDIGRFRRTDLRRYNVLIFPPAGSPGYRSILGSSGIERLRKWIEAGGTAIGLGGGAAFLADKDVGLTQTRRRSEALDRYPPVVFGVSAADVEAGGPFRAAGIRAPVTTQPDGDGSDKKKGKSTEVARIERESPYDIAPILGPGARPFAAGLDLGAPAPSAPVDLETWIKPLLPEGVNKPTPEDVRAADSRLQRFRPRGAFLRADLDPEAWLTWGLGKEMTAWIGTPNAFVAEPPVQIAARFPEADRLHLGGLLWPEAAGRIAHTAYATREGKGRGQVILFLNDPTYRGWMLDSRRMFANAVLYGPGLGTRWATPW